jgi:ABC-2 type transport system permease protein
MPGSSALKYDKNSGYNITELFVTESQGDIWNETEATNFIDDQISMNTAANEMALNQAPVALALHRKVRDKDQKIIILGDADCISNGELSMTRTGVDAANYNFILGAFYWLSNEEVPVDVRRPAPSDNTLFVSMSVMRLSKWLLIGLLPIIMLLTYIIIWIRRRSH